MKRAANHDGWRRLLVWLVVISMLLPTFSSVLPALADSTGDPVDNNEYTIEELLASKEDLTWVFAGDSITHNATFTAGMNGYGEWFEQYLNSHDRDEDSVIISAWGGADVYDFQTLENTPAKSGTKDYPGMGIENMITKYDPDVVFIKLGMNDRYKTTEEYTKYYKQMIDSITSICEKSYNKIPKIILLTPTPTAGESVYDDMREESKVEANWDSTLRHCEAVEQIAEQYRFTCVNLREAFMDAQLKLGDDYFATFFRDPSDGGIHPNAAGQYIMFKKLAETLGLYEASDPIFQYEYEDFLAGELYTDLTKDITYVNGYDTVTVADTQEQPELLASIDFTSANGAFRKFTSAELAAYTDKNNDEYKDFIYNNATHIDLTDSSICDDPLTLAEAQSLTNEYSVVFRAKLEQSVMDSQPVLLIGQTEENWNNALVLGVPGKMSSNKAKIYSRIYSGGTNQNAVSTNFTSINAAATMDGSWHDFAVVQQKDKIVYYMDGVEFATSTIHIKDGFSIGSLVSEGNFVAQVGSYTKKSRTYNLAADMDFYQLYKGALTADQVKELADKSGTFADSSTVVTTDADEMNKSMPSALSTGTKTIASVEFDSTNGSFTGATSYAKATKYDLTKANTDPLTLEEVQGLKKEFSIVFRAKLGANQKPRETNAVLYISNNDADFDSSLVVHVPSSTEALYYKVIDSGKNGKNTAIDSKWTFSLSGSQKSTDAWHTIAVVASSEGLRYYIDGNLTDTIATVSSIDIGSLFSNLTEEGGFVAHVGAICSQQQGTYSLKASMDWYQLYGQALTAAEVAELSGTEEPAQNQMDAVMPKLDLDTSGMKMYTSAYTWAQAAPEKGADVWAVAGGSQLMGNDGTVVNRSIYRLIDNAVRRTPTHRGTRLVDAAYDGHTSADLLKDYDAMVDTYKPLAYLYLPELSEVYEDGYVHSEQKVAEFKGNVQEWLNKNKTNNVISILWTPLASSDETINTYISDYAEAIRSLMTDADNKMLFFDANRFMNDNMAKNNALSRNWFADEQQLTSLGARDVAYAFCMLSGMYRIADPEKAPKETDIDELTQHDLRVTSDTCLFKGEYTRDLIESAVTVSGTQVTVDVSEIKEVYSDMTNFSFQVLPFANASSYNTDLYEVTATANGNAYTFTAPCSDPIIAVFGESNGVKYRFADCTAEVETADIRHLKQDPEGVYLDSLEVVGAEAIGFKADKTSYDVTLYSYQRYVQILAAAQDGLTITVDGQEVQSGVNSDLITVDSTKEVKVVAADSKGTEKTYTLKLTRPDYPDIIITEVMTDAEYKTGNGGDDYDMVEIYNTTDRELNLKDYSLGHTKDYRYTNIKQLTDYPTFYFTGDNQIFSASAERSRTYTGINQITKYSTYWDGGEAEPDYIAFPAHSTMVIWVKYLDKSMTYDTLITALKDAGEDYTLHVDGQPVVPDKEQLVVAEVPASLSSEITKKNAVGKHAALTLPSAILENFYLADFNGEPYQQANSKNYFARGWLFITKAGAERDDNGSITEAGNDIVSASKFIKIDQPKKTDKTKYDRANKLSSVFSYNVERGMSLIERDGQWDESEFDENCTTGHTSDQQGYANKTSFGAIEYWQKPYELADQTKATVDDQTPDTVQKGTEAKIQLGLSDNTDVRYLELYVKKAGATEYTVLKEDFVLQAGIANKGVSEDITSKDYSYDLGKLQGDVSYYGFVIDGNGNKTEFGSEESPCVIQVLEDMPKPTGDFKVTMSITDDEGQPATEASASVAISVEKGTAQNDFDSTYDILNGGAQAGTLTLSDGKLTGTISMKDGETFTIAGLPEGAEYTVTVTVPKGYELAEGTSEAMQGSIISKEIGNIQFHLQQKETTYGDLQIQLQIQDKDGNPAADTVKAQVSILVEKGEAVEDFMTSHEIYSGERKVAILSLRDGSLSGTYFAENGETLEVRGLPEFAKYTVQITVPDGYSLTAGSAQEGNGQISAETGIVAFALKENAVSGETTGTDGDSSGDSGNESAGSGSATGGTTTGGSTETNGSSSSQTSGTNATGDQTKIGYWIAVMAVAGIAGIWISRRKKKTNQEA